MYFEAASKNYKRKEDSQDLLMNGCGIRKRWLESFVSARKSF